MRNFLMLVCVVVCLASLGCCGPIGPGCGIPMGCNDCDGLGASQAYNGRPMQSLKRSLVCGSGCGESYVGEWMSTPPDAQDPCCGDQFVGGATKCRPFCWQRGTILRGLYGGRYCSGAESSASCGCGTSSCGGCDSGCGGEIISEGYVSDNYIETGYSGGSTNAGCSTCDSRNAVGSSSGTRVARSQPANTVDARLERRMYR